MNTKIMTTALGMAMVALVLPTNAYHIDQDVAGDWDVSNPLLIACESNGPTDERLNRPAPSPGVGGLCTTGRNDVTGVAAPAVRPAKDEWTRLDVCDAVTTFRSGVPCAPAGRTDQHGFTGEVGAFTCFVPTDSVPLDLLFGALVNNDYALYYQELYAWWSYDGDGNYTALEEPAFHGHASMYVDPIESKPGASLTGSAETAAVAPPGIAGGWLSDDPATAIDGFTNNCAGSPSNADCDCRGPVVRDLNQDNLATPQPALCAQTWNGASLTTFPCLPEMCDVPVGVAVLAQSFDPGHGGMMVEGTMACSGLVSTTATIDPSTGAGASADSTFPNPLGGTGPTCTRTPTANDLPNNADTTWEVRCAPDP